MPMRIRKARASIFTVGCRATNSPIGPAANIITPTAITTAAIMIVRWLAMPTAVITESSEKTTSRSRIWTRTAENEAATRELASPSSPSSFSWISRVALVSRKRPPTSRIRSRPEMPLPNTENRGDVSRAIQAREASRPMRMNMASPSPSRRALGCCALASLPTRMEMKMMLSIPSTISKTVRVSSATQLSGLVIQSMARGL
jgi:hypothetical protein